MASDYYDVLGVARDASPDQIKRAYRALARQYHPDVNPDPAAEETFKDLSLAYSVLSDPDKRQRYDRFGAEAFQGGGNGGGGGFTGGFGFDLEDLVRSFFGGGFAQADSGHGSDLRYDLTLTLEDALNGCERPVELTKPEYCAECDGSGAEDGAGRTTCGTCRGAGRVVRTQTTFFGQFQSAATCPACRGSGTVVEKVCTACHGEGRAVQTTTLRITVPPGVDEGDRIRLRGQGEAGRHGGSPGDLYVICHLADHPRFERKAQDLATEVAISFSQAALGDTIPVRGLGGDELSIELPAGTQTGAHFEVAGQGMPTTRNPRRRGALHVFVRVHTPTNLSVEELALFRQLAELRQEEPSEEHRGFFRKVWDRIVGGDEG